MLRTEGIFRQKRTEYENIPLLDDFVNNKKNEKNQVESKVLRAIQPKLNSISSRKKTPTVSYYRNLNFALHSDKSEASLSKYEHVKRLLRGILEEQKEDCTLQPFGNRESTWDSKKINPLSVAYATGKSKEQEKLPGFIHINKTEEASILVDYRANHHNRAIQTTHNWISQKSASILEPEPSVICIYLNKNNKKIVEDIEEDKFSQTLSDTQLSLKDHSSAAVQTKKITLSRKNQTVRKNSPSGDNKDTSLKSSKIKRRLGNYSNVKYPKFSVINKNAHQ